ncbi:hypothetical protein J1N35_002945 [Gossypium stocksii]|uniref:Uncharacterized protein n=1 Tax=Gossypium stocksii TaxID=47602 RepID=A0A9D4AN95_9ROSI|nr:hypothetical protein J1N35_002945 [Gossypium stocksii]
MSFLPTDLRTWLGSMENWQWTQSYDEGFRYGQMTTNLVEAVNFVLRHTRHLPISTVVSATFYRLAILIPNMGLRQATQIEAGHVYVEAIRKAMAINSRRAQTMNAKLYSRDLETFRVQEYIGYRSGLPPRSYVVDLRNRRCEREIFQTLRYLYVHVHATCAKANLNVEQFIDKIYTLQRTLRIWGNEFPVMPDVSNWKVPSPAFEMVPDRSLRRHLKGQPQSTRIRNDVDVRETGEPKLCTVC